MWWLHVASLETARVSEQPAVLVAKPWPAQQYRSLFALVQAGLTSLSPHSYFPTTHSLRRYLHRGFSGSFIRNAPQRDLHSILHSALCRPAAGISRLGSLALLLGVLGLPSPISLQERERHLNSGSNALQVEWEESCSLRSNPQSSSPRAILGKAMLWGN